MAEEGEAREGDQGGCWGANWQRARTDTLALAHQSWRREAQSPPPPERASMV